MPANVLAWFTEYKTRKLFGLTHDQYVDDPEEATAWMLNIDQVVNDVENKRTKQAEGS